MFIENPDLNTLRQGDIVANVPFPLPPLKSGELTFLGSYAELGGAARFEPRTETIRRTDWFTGHVPVAIACCAVLSQCCDVDSRQNPPPPTFVLCRLAPLPDSIRRRTDLYNILTENVDPYGSSRPYFSLFHVGFHSRLGAEYVADYGQPMTVRWGDYGAVLRRKVLEMDDISRAKFRVKAGAYLGRPTREEIDAGIADPWRSDESRRIAESVRDRLRRAWHVAIGRG
jgi:hypothetical protein